MATYHNEPTGHNPHLEPAPALQTDPINPLGSLSSTGHDLKDSISDTASELTITYPEVSRTTSVVSEATSQASNIQLLNGKPAPLTVTTEPKNHAQSRPNGVSAETSKLHVFKSSRRSGPDDYFNPIIKQHVLETGHKTGTVLDAKKRREMCAFHRWAPRTDVGKALMEDRDSDALQGVLTSKKLGSWASRRHDYVITDLHLAAAFGVLEVVDALLAITNIKSVNNNDMIRKVPFAPHMPIDFAAAGDHVEVVASLIMAGSAVDSASVTPLCFAVKSEAYGVVDLLLEHGCDPLAVCDYGSPLHRACKANSSLIVKALSSVMHKEKACIVSFQILHPLPLEHPSYFGLGHTSLLHIKVDPFAWAVFNGSHEAVEILLSHGVATDIEYNAEFISGGKRVSHVTALSLAAAKGLDRIVRFLLDRDPSSKIKDHAFAAAIYNKEDQTARILADAGARNTFVMKAWGKLLGVDGVTGKHVSAEA